MKLWPRRIALLPGTTCSIPGCSLRAEFDVYLYDIQLHVDNDGIEEWYTQDATCPFVCRSHMLRNELGALGERRSGGLVLYPHTNRHRQIGYTKYVPLPEVHEPLIPFAPVDATLELTKSGDAEEQDTRARVQRVLAEMPRRDAEILRAIFLDERDVASICGSFSIDRSYIRVLLYRAKEKFRKEYLRAGALWPGGKQPSLPVPAAQRGFDILCSSVNDELFDKLRHEPHLMRELQPRRFEELVADMFARRGCTVKLSPATRDGGVDIYAVDHQAFGESLYLIECKRYSENRKVGVEPVRGLYAVTEAKRATRGILVTTSFFTNDAIAFASPLEYRLALRDFDALREWLAAMKLGGAGST